MNPFFYRRNWYWSQLWVMRRPWRIALLLFVFLPAYIIMAWLACLVAAPIDFIICAITGWRVG